jgi:hypothetical protein
MLRKMFRERPPQQWKIEEIPGALALHKYKKSEKFRFWICPGSSPAANTSYFPGEHYLFLTNCLQPDEDEPVVRLQHID